VAVGRGGVRIPIITEFDSKGIDRFGKKMQSVGKSLTRNVTLPIVGLGAAAVKAFSDFEDKLTQSFAIMGDLSEDMKNDMSDAAREVAKNLVCRMLKRPSRFSF
jgi:phage-related minor tail protein